MRQYRCVIVRHAQTEASRDKSLYDVLDPDSLPLSDVGVVQASAVGSLLASKGFNNPIIVSSPSQRCLQTASVISSRLPCSNRSTVIVDDLRAQSWGDMDFVGRRELMKSWSYPDGILNSCFPGGESGWSVLTRAKMALVQIVSLLDIEGVVVVTHGIVARCMLAGLLGWTVAQLNQSNPIDHGGGAIVSLCTLSVERELVETCGIKSSPAEVPLLDVIAIECFANADAREARQSDDI